MEAATDAQMEVNTDDQIEDAADLSTPDIVESETDIKMVGTTYSYMYPDLQKVFNVPRIQK